MRRETGLLDEIRRLEEELGRLQGDRLPADADGLLGQHTAAIRQVDSSSQTYPACQ